MKRVPMTWTSNERQCCAVKPAVTRPPQDVTALVGSDVVFECGAAGDPAPHVTWRRDGADAGPLPAGRARPTENRQGLRIERVSASDSGRYVCDVENVVGQASAGATLTVLVPPTWDWSSSSASASSSTSLSSVSSASSGNSSPLPKEVRTYPGHTVSIDCPVDGVPKPLVFWKREGKPIPALVARESSDASTRYFCRFFFIKKIRPTLFNGCIDLFLRVCASSTGNSGARWTVLSNGTLVVRDVRKEDAAALWCGAVNEAGSLVARTRLDVTSVSLPPPVVIEVGPANQTLPLKSPASLPCQAEGQPVRWLKGTVQFHHLFSPTQPF